MVRKTRSKTADNEPEDFQMLTDKDLKAKKRGHSADTEPEAPPLKKKANRGRKVDGVSGKVSYLLTSTFEH